MQKYTNDILNNAKIIKRASELKTMLSDFLMILVQLDAFNGVDYNDSESILYKSYLLSTIGRTPPKGPLLFARGP